MKKLLLIALMAMVSLGCFAKYTVHSVSGQVQVNHNGKVESLAKGRELSGVDKVIVGKGGVVEILNSADNKVYRCDQEGGYLPTQIMMNARKSAGNKLKTVASNARFGGAKSSKGGTVYEEGCMVTRALGSYDPEGATTQVDASQLALSMAAKLKGSPSDSLPTPMLHGVPEKGEGLEFSIDNTFDFPIYVNVVKHAENSSEIAISELGQPVGCYILLPGQSLMRRHSRSMTSGEKHMLILTRGYFDIDEVITKTSELSADNDQPLLGAGHIYITEL